MKLLPRTLFGRLIIILVTGMLAAQILTSSIWYDVRHSQVLEIPTRLIASRLADIVRMVQQDPVHAELFLRHLQSEDFDLRLIDKPMPANKALSSADMATEHLLNEVIERKSGFASNLHLLSLSLLDERGHIAGLPALFGSSPAAGQFLLELNLPDGRWLRVQAYEEQGWTSLTPVQVLFDYFMRIYLLRIIVVVIIALLAVRLAIRPLIELTRAAEALGRDIQRPPLPLEGPVEVRRAAQAFNSMQQRLIASIAERTRFLAAISHDLRTPITRMRLRTEMLNDEVVQGRLRKDLDDMEAMVTATMTFVSSGETREARQNVEINALLQALQADLADIGAQVLIHGRAHSPLSGYADSLKRCVQNLLENAIRYGRDVEIQVEDQPQLLRIIVRDRGPGVPEDMLEQIIEPFYRLENSRNADTGGHGLGLSIAHTIAAAHNGTLKLRNRDGGGLEAVVELPR
ncbi:signal transduction histidine kinase [Pseudomonas sp. JUb42]|uniref:ATP-binding protein n=1 Tax=Pseudomonas sp. JUb42 TaxID=2940611 RepID=UPI00216A3A3D|nr:ATP-binding protein [Pseudomonas sp. JUb42]MCS3467794.1 signal transduction histidine kinase [Pseudomonas sp. JUb42]